MMKRKHKLQNPVCFLVAGRSILMGENYVGKKVVIVKDDMTRLQATKLVDYLRDEMFVGQHEKIELLTKNPLQ